MVKKKLLCLSVITLNILLLVSLHVFAKDPVKSLNPAPGEKKTLDITWSRTTEPKGAIVLPVASWNWSDVKKINHDRITDVWDGGALGTRYIQDAKRPWDIATWHTDRVYWNGTSDVRRFYGEFSIPEGYTASDEATLSSVGDYSSLGLDNIVAINDNIYVFIYPKGQTIDDSNFLDYFAFWTGTACQEAASAVNGGKPITFHGILGTTPHDYKTITGSPIPKENLLSHTDGWYCEAVDNNVGRIMQKSPEATQFVIDLIIEDFAEDGGMDRFNLTLTKTTQPQQETTTRELIGQTPPTTAGTTMTATEQTPIPIPSATAIKPLNPPVEPSEIILYLNKVLTDSNSNPIGDGKIFIVEVVDRSQTLIARVELKANGEAVEIRGLKPGEVYMIGEMMGENFTLTGFNVFGGNLLEQNILAFRATLSTPNTAGRINFTINNVTAVELIDKNDPPLDINWPQVPEDEIIDIPPWEIPLGAPLTDASATATPLVDTPPTGTRSGGLYLIAVIVVTMAIICLKMISKRKENC